MAASATELEELIVRMTGDVSSFLSAMKEAVDAAKQSAAAVEKVAEKVESTGDHLKAFAGTVASAFSAFKIVDWLKQGRSEFHNAELASVRLSSAIRAQGRDVKLLSADYNEFASQLQKTTVLSDETVLGMLKQAEAMGVTGEAAKRAVRNAATIAAITGEGAGGAAGFMRQAIALEQGHAEMLGRQFSELKDIKDETEKAARAQVLLAKNFAIVGDEAATGWGKAQIFTNQYSDIMEEVGRIVSKFVSSPLRDARKALTAWFAGLNEMQKTAVVGGAAFVAFLLSIGPAIAALGPILSVVTSGFVALRAVMAATAAFSLVEFLANLGTNFLVLVDTLEKSRIAAMALRAALVVGVVYGLSELIFAAAGGNKALANLNEQLARSKDLAAQLRAATEGQQKGRLAEIAGLPPEDKVAALETEAAKAQKAVADLSAALEQVRKAQDAADKTARHIPLAGAGYQAEFDAAKQRVDETKAQYDQAREYAGKVQEELNKAQNAGANKRTLESIAEFTKQLQIQAETFGQNERQVQLYKFSLEGATEAQLASARAAAEEIDRLEEAKKAREADDKALEKYIDDFNERVKKVQQDIQTPWDKFADQVENLNELLELGGITQEEYGLAVEKAEGDMAKAEETTRNTAQSLRDLDAVIFGSADSFKRLAAYEESLNALVAPDKGRARVGSTQGEDTGRVLAQIEKNTAKSADKEPVEFEEVGVD